MTAWLAELAPNHCSKFLQGWDEDLEDVLTPYDLRHVKELKIDHPRPDKYHRIHHSTWQEWPETWSLLSALTSLSCTLHPHADPHIPAVLNRMTSLRNLHVYHDHHSDDSFDQEGLYGGDEDLAYKTEIVNKVIDNTRGLSRLTSLVIGDYEKIGLRSK